MRRLPFILVAFLLVTSCPVAIAYFETYPPYKFKDGPPDHLNIKPVINSGSVHSGLITKADSEADSELTEYRSLDKSIYMRREETKETLDFVVKDGPTVLDSVNNLDGSIPEIVYYFDIDENGLKDIIVFYSDRGTGFGVWMNHVGIFLKRKEGGYEKIYFDTMAAGLEDFVDMSRDGKYQVIVTDALSYGHTYYHYNIYEFENYKLVNANIKYKGFPKFVWFTHKNNDKDTSHLSKTERQRFVKDLDRRIQYQSIQATLPETHS